MQSSNKFVLHPDKNKEQKIKNKRQSMKPSPIQSEAQTQEATQTGMVFPQTVLLSIRCDKKSIFSDIVSHNQEVKLTSQGFAGIATAYIQKVKLYSNKIPKKISLKVESQGDQHYFYLEKQDTIPIFTKLIWLKLATMNIFTDFQAKLEQEISGKGLKMDLLGKWAPVYLKLSKNNGLQISSDEKFSSRTSIRNTNQLWTRFQMIETKCYLVVKFWVGLYKYQLGLPICRETTWWMQGFCQMLVRQ